MKKNKKYTVLKIAGAALLVPLAVNKLIFFLSQKKDKIDMEEIETYSWRLGEIKYKKIGVGKPVLLLHGIGAGCSMDEWEKNSAALSEKYQLFIPDLLGFGLSDKPKTTYTAYMYATLINDFIRDEIGKEVCVIASSTSAAFAMMAQKMEPENFKKMILISPTGLVEEVAQNDDTSFRRLLESPLIGTSIYNLICSKFSIRSFLGKNVFFAKEKFVTKEMVDIYYKNAHRGHDGGKFALASFLSKFMNCDCKLLLPEIKIPLYFVWGENAVINPVENMNVAEAIKPRAKYAIFEKTRLLPHYENPEEFNALVKEFFR